MDNQNTQQNQNLSQNQANASSPKYKVEVKLDDPVKIKNEEQKDSQEQQPKAKRTRKTIEQEIAELDAKRQRLMEKKRSQDAHEKIVFGATVLAMLKDMQKSGDPVTKILIDKLREYCKEDKNKVSEIINKNIDQILKIKKADKPEQQDKNQ